MTQSYQLTTTDEVPIMPGQYLFRPNPFVPWINVHVFKESAKQQQHLRVRLAGVEIDAAKLINRGEWKPI